MKSIALLFGLAVFYGSASAASAQDSVGDTSAASGASVNVGGDLAASGVRTVAAASVIPVGSVAAGSAVAGSVAGGVAGQALFAGAGGMSTAAGDSASFATGPLPVTREVVVAPQPMPRLPYNAAQPDAAPAPR